MTISRAAVRASLFGIACLLGCAVSSSGGEDSERLLTVDHYVKVTSTVPAIAGQAADVYVREKVLAGSALRGATLTDRVGY